MTTQAPLWQPSEQRIAGSQMTQFQEYVSKGTKLKFNNYDELHAWSIENVTDFWASVWSFCAVTHSQAYDKVIDDESLFPGAKWFTKSRLNFAQNLLRYDDDRVALVGLEETGKRQTITYKQLNAEVAKFASALRLQGVAKGDRVAGFMPNIIETVVAMLATTSIGAVWTSCSPDFGINGVCDRFGQVEPKLLLCSEAYLYNGKQVDNLAKVRQIQERITSIEKTIVVATISADVVLDSLPNSVLYDQFLNQNPEPLVFEQLPFDHPVYINYSSGTTGVPKCIVHGAGGTLLQHLKELKLHTDVTRDDVLFYFTTCGWMMWNWLVSGLACGCPVVLFDGSPFAKDGHVLLEAIEREGITVFGTSAKYLSALEKQGISPSESHDLSSVKTILSTGSPLSATSYDYVYNHFKQDLCLSSICGGTDIISCFILGNPNLPVYRGEIQCIGLGMAVEIWNDDGEPCIETKGELVCVKPFPSTPVSFWQDHGDEKFRAAYFESYPNIWAQGDYGEITSNSGAIIHGRSDAVLNPGGVRIGTAEIYRQVEKIEAVVDSIAIGQDFNDDVRVILFVVLKGGLVINDELELEIKSVIRNNTTPRHVPAKIIQVDDIPRTISGKAVELAVRNVVHNRPVKNKDALANPQALELFKSLPELLE